MSGTNWSVIVVCSRTIVNLIKAGAGGSFTVPNNKL